MKFGVNIEFFEPSKPDDLRKGKLLEDEKSRNLIEFEGSWIDFFKPIEVLLAKAIGTKELYTLVNCVFERSEGSQIRFVINELYKGAYLSKVTVADCKGATARFSGLTEWINKSRISIEMALPNEWVRISSKKMFEKNIRIGKDMTLVLGAFCNHRTSYRQVILTNESQVSFSVDKPLSRLQVQENIFAFYKFLSLFTERIPRLIDLEFQFEDQNIVKCLHYKPIDISENDSLLSLDQFEEHLAGMLNVFYSKKEKFEKIIDLLNASIQNKTAEISFLNITTAFEVYHQSFQESGNTALRQRLAAELNEAGLMKEIPKEWTQILRHFHLFKLVENIEFFQKNFSTPLATITRLRSSRNYYTHYNKKGKEVWSPNALLYMNMKLRQLIKGVLLIEMQMPVTLINRLLNNRAAIIVHMYEKNEYSAHYKAEDTEVIDPSIDSD